MGYKPYSYSVVIAMRLGEGTLINEFLEKRISAAEETDFAKNIISKEKNFVEINLPNVEIYSWHKPRYDEKNPGIEEDLLKSAMDVLGKELDFIALSMKRFATIKDYQLQED